VKDADVPVMIAECGMSGNSQRWTMNSNNEIVNLDTNLCLSAVDCNVANGAQLTLSPCNINSSCSANEWTYTSSNYLTSNEDDSNCLDVWDFTGPLVDFWDCNGGVNQQWTFNKTDSSLRSEGQCLSYNPNYDQQIWFVPMADKSIVVILLNTGAAETMINCDFTLFGWTSNTMVYIRDLWLHEPLGYYTGSFAASIASHDVLMIQLTPTS